MNKSEKSLGDLWNTIRRPVYPILESQKKREISRELIRRYNGRKLVSLTKENGHPNLRTLKCS